MNEQSKIVASAFKMFPLLTAKQKASSWIFVIGGSLLAITLFVGTTWNNNYPLGITRGAKPQWALDRPSFVHDNDFKTEIGSLTSDL
jgi:hypothetical protein